MNNTLTDLKRLLDEGETLVNQDRMVWFERPIYHYYNGERDYHLRASEIFQWMGDLSLWHQRDQNGAEKPVSEPPLKGPDVLMEQVMEAYSAPYKPEKPVMMMVPIEQWDALQKFEQRALG